MSNRELAKVLIDKIPENKLLYIIPYLQSEAIPDETPNSETLEAFAELDNGGGHMVFQRVNILLIPYEHFELQGGSLLPPFPHFPFLTTMDT